MPLKYWRNVWLNSSLVWTVAVGSMLVIYSCSPPTVGTFPVTFAGCPPGISGNLLIPPVGELVALEVGIVRNLQRLFQFERALLLPIRTGAVSSCT